MMELLKQWIMRLAATAIICSGVLAVTPEGKAKKAVRMVCGAAAVIALLSLKTDFNLDIYSRKLAGLKNDAYEYAQDIEDTNKNLTRDIIEEKCEAYILDKGESLGINRLEADVKVRWSAEEECFYPVSAGVKADATEAKRKNLELLIESSLGISREKQTWSGYDEE